MKPAAAPLRNPELMQLALLLVALGLFYFLVIPAGIPDPSDMGLDQGLPPSFSARATSWVAGLILAGRLVQLAWRGSRGGARSAEVSPAPQPAGDELTDEVVLGARVLGGIAAALAYAFVLIPVAGFIVASLVLLVTLLALLGERQPLRLLVLPVVVTAGVWLLFEKALGVTLPPGHLLAGWIWG